MIICKYLFLSNYRMLWKHKELSYNGQKSCKLLTVEHFLRVSWIVHTLKTFTTAGMIVHMQWVSGHKDIHYSFGLPVKTKFFQATACIINYFGIVVFIKSAIDQIKYYPRWLTLYHLFDSIDTFLRAAADHYKQTRG